MKEFDDEQKKLIEGLLTRTMELYDSRNELNIMNERGKYRPKDYVIPSFEEFYMNKQRDSRDMFWFCLGVAVIGILLIVSWVI